MLTSPVASWLDHHHAVYWTAAACATALFAGWVARGVRMDPAESGDRTERFAPAALVIALLLAAWRWPFCFDPAGFNPDEGQLVAGALTLAHDPVFWGAVDGGTAGPLDFYVLLWVKLFALPVGFLTARITGLLLIGSMLFFAYRLLRLFLSAGPARLAVLPASLFVALATEDDFIHYSTEHLSLSLLAAGTFLLVRRCRDNGGGRLAWWCGGLCLGLLPWAKLQSIPLGAAVLFWVSWSLWRDTALDRAEKWRRYGQLLLAGLAPTVLGLVLVGMAGVWPVFFRNYVLQNFHYVADGYSLASLWEITVTSLNRTWHFQACLAAPFLAALVGSAFAFFPRHRMRGGPGSLGFALFLAAAIAVMAPRHPYPHYLLFLLLPLTIWYGGAVGVFWDHSTSRRYRTTLAVACLALTAVWPLALRFTQPTPQILGRLAATLANPRTAAGEILLAVTRPGDRLAVWGWMNDFYVETGLPQATRQSTAFFCIQPNPQFDYHRAEYLATLRRTRPAAIIDAVGPTADFFQARGLQGHECFPDLAAFIRENYVELVDVEYARIYVRPDRLAATPLDAARIRALVEAGRPVRGKPSPEAVSIVRESLRPNIIGGRAVRMMLPRSELSWLLDGTEREFHYESGYDPRAYLEGTSNGTLFTVELTTPGGATYPLSSRLLDPGHRPEDRGLVSNRVLLPPMPKGSRLTLRTSPGPEENDVWDWAYLASAAFERSPRYVCLQFPGFNRLPVAVNDDVAYLEKEAGQEVLVLHAPARLVFPLQGGEKSLGFDFGLRTGTYENGGNTDGAGCTVTLRRTDGSETTVFRRQWQPVQEPLDRGRQHADVALPADIEAGTELVLAFDAGPAGGTAWDWTYVADLQIR